VPSSLMMGVTTHLATDVASAPFLWVVPLALYLSTFVIAFQDRPLINRDNALLFQGAALAACMATLPFHTSNILVQIFVHLSCFFLTALVAHQTLLARRPEPGQLTEFYLWMSVGGVVGGLFNAFVAPAVFSWVLEYPIMVLAGCLIRPWGGRSISSLHTTILFLGIGAALASVGVLAQFVGKYPFDDLMALAKIFLAITTVCVFLLRGHALPMTAVGLVLMMAAFTIGDRVDVEETRRSFFGVMRTSHTDIPGLGGSVRMLSHGTTLHGAQAQNPKYRCRPLVYYAPETPIGQVFRNLQQRKLDLRIGAVGLGTGAVAAYTRRGDRLSFFEIDPLVVKISSDPKYFSYTTECAKGAINYIIGDARLTLNRIPDNEFDVLLIDAFSSDSVPAHLLTVEALKGYLKHLKPDGILILHLSNRNLELRSPAIATAKAAGGYPLLQRYPSYNRPRLWESAEDAVIVGRTPKALSSFAFDRRWVVGNDHGVKPWTDDYTNLIGALLARGKEAAQAK